MQFGKTTILSLIFIYAMNYTKDKTVSLYFYFTGLAIIYGIVHLSNPLRNSKWNQEEILLYIDAQSINNFRFQFQCKQPESKENYFFFSFFYCQLNIRQCCQTAFLQTCTIPLIQHLSWYKAWQLQILKILQMFSSLGEKIIMKLFIKIYEIIPCLCMPDILDFTRLVKTNLPSVCAHWESMSNFQGRGFEICIFVQVSLKSTFH